MLWSLNSNIIISMKLNNREGSSLHHVSFLLPGWPGPRMQTCWPTACSWWVRLALAHRSFSSTWACLNCWRAMRLAANGKVHIATQSHSPWSVVLQWCMSCSSSCMHCLAKSLLDQKLSFLLSCGRKLMCHKMDHMAKSFVRSFNERRKMEVSVDERWLQF